MKATRVRNIGAALPGHVVEKLLLLVGEGLTDEAVARKLDIDRTTVVRQRQLHGVAPGKVGNPLSPSELGRLRQIERRLTSVQSGVCKHCGDLLDLAGEKVPLHRVRLVGSDPRFAPVCPGSGRWPLDLDRESGVPL